GLIGDPRLSRLDPRHRALKVKDLRAYAASVIVDAGGTPYEAAALLRHANVQTTNRFYTRAQDERSQDSARSKLRIDHDLSLAERIDALWSAWSGAYPKLTQGILVQDAATVTDTDCSGSPPSLQPWDGPTRGQGGRSQA
ncbi:MAG: hypothetical protein PSX37_07125, partial [bacterium]|nr:hypothetical protein [bacterium]